jgi:Ca2+-binding RTX toxin-like protein
VRRTVSLLAVMALVLCLGAGAALAVGDSGPGVTKTCRPDCVGTEYPDTLKGTSAENTIHGSGGKESPTYGDLNQGHGGKDTLHGDQGGDKIEGGAAADLVNGDAGDDALIGGPGHDHINAGSGSDVIRAADGFRDFIDCGSSSRDKIFYDRNLDVFRDCERTSAS